MRAMHAAIVVLPMLIAGCATTTPTPQLNAAHQTYKQAASGPAPQYAPAQLGSAQRSLGRADQANAWQDPNQVSFARLAQSRAEYANISGRDGVALMQKEQATTQLTQVRQERREQIATARTQQAAQGAALMQGMVPLMKIADARLVVNGETQFIFTRDLNFEVNKAVIPPAGKAQLDKIADGLQQSKDTVVVVQGFTDSTGTRQINDPLSERRADAVADYLASRGVRREAIKTNGFGDDHPVATNDTAAGRSKNRRAVVLINLVGTAAGATNMQGGCGGQSSGQQQQPKQQQQP
jgi:outer membrane protein OmpA-like peptidoglycan-associated protein